MQTDEEKDRYYRGWLFRLKEAVTQPKRIFILETLHTTGIIEGQKDMQEKIIAEVEKQFTNNSDINKKVQDIINLIKNI